MIRFDRVVRVLLDDVQSRRGRLAGDPCINMRAVGHDLYRDRAGCHRASEKAPRDRQVTPRGPKDVNDLAI